MSGKKVNQSECAVIFGIHRNTLSNWVKQGCPYVQKANKPQGKDWVLDTAHVAQWREDLAIKNSIGDTKSVDADELKQRKLAAETSIAEIEAAKARGEVVEVEAVMKVVANDYITIKQQMRQLAQRLAPIIVGETNEDKIKLIIGEEIDQALTELSNEYYEES
jgi:phage terminase Nu1 subunit (DNA packaging protein)